MIHNKVSLAIASLLYIVDFMVNLVAQASGAPSVSVPVNFEFVIRLLPGRA
jgi:hypothetical protein